MPAPKMRRERLVTITLFGALGFNFPLLALFDQQTLWFGIPVLFFYLFALWGLLIGLLAFIMGRPGRRRAERLSGLLDEEGED